MTHTPHAADSTVTAVLGPTNTGKTFLAMDRLLGHASGMIGFPLRLLARENYDKAVAAKGADQVALITGEEKIIPGGARYFICTVESMPVDRDVSFFCVDEIQLAADRERGHVFTDRLLHGRGKVETMFLGAETIRPLIRRLVPKARFESRPRFSKLTYSGPKKLTRLPRRSAVVAFSVSEVYGIADLIRRQRGGTAIVMGALSPRTRNAQVALYQSGEVDYLVATDAIGMGLNMDVDHVAFASLSKFDGRAPRALTAPELAQIAGRAGRHMNDGTFGTTADSPTLDPEIITQIEGHEFPAIKSLYWRNTDLRFASVEALIHSLKKGTPGAGLTKPPAAEDQAVLELLAKDADVRDRAKGAKRVELLWDVAQVPDFRKLRSDSHSRLLHQVYLHLSGEREVLSEDWIADHIKRLDRKDGDIHTLMDRIAAIRIWTYLSNRPGWVENAAEWQAQSRAVEDRLSDRLHDKLTQQFIDRRTAHLVKKLKTDEAVAPVIDDKDRVMVDGHFIGQMEGLTFKADKTGQRTADRALANTASAALVPELSRRAQALCAAESSAFALDDSARIHWHSVAIAKLTPGSHILNPGLDLIADERLTRPDREKSEHRLQTWIEQHIATVLPGVSATQDSSLSGAARGLAYRLAESLGTVARADVDAQIKSLTDEDRKALTHLGVRFGLDAVFVPAALKAEPVRLRALLWNVFNSQSPFFVAPPAGRVSFETQPGIPAAFYLACGFRPVKGTAYRVDMVERFSNDVRRLLREKVKVLPPEILPPLGIGSEKAVNLLKSLAFIADVTEDGLRIAAKPPRKKRGGDKPAKKTKRQTNKKGAKKTQYDPDSPFAKLKDLVTS